MRKRFEAKELHARCIHFLKSLLPEGRFPGCNSQTANVQKNGRGDHLKITLNEGTELLGKLLEFSDSCG